MQATIINYVFWWSQQESRGIWYHIGIYMDILMPFAINHNNNQLGVSGNWHPQNSSWTGDSQVHLVFRYPIFRQTRKDRRMGWCAMASDVASDDLFFPWKIGQPLRVQKLHDVPLKLRVSFLDKPWGHGGWEGSFLSIFCAVVMMVCCILFPYWVESEAESNRFTNSAACYLSTDGAPIECSNVIMTVHIQETMSTLASNWEAGWAKGWGMIGLQPRLPQCSWRQRRRQSWIVEISSCGRFVEGLGWIGRKGNRLTLLRFLEFRQERGNIYIYIYVI